MERMKIERQISTKTYIAAFVLTVVVFCLGLFLGMVVDEQAQGEVEKDISALERDLYLSRILHQDL